MGVSLPRHLATVYAQRRTRVHDALGSTSGLVFAGEARPRNYAGNTYPYRADSTFLYLTGLQLPGAVLLLEAGRSVLYCEELPDDDSIWHGPQPSEADILRATGIDEIRPIALAFTEVKSADERGELGVLPAVDPLARVAQVQQLRPNWPCNARLPALCEADALLVQAVIAARLIHDQAAISDMRQCAKATKAGHLAGMQATRAGRYEYEVQAAIEGRFIEHGATQAYSCIISVHGEVLHNFGHDNLMRDGDLLLVDAGAEHDGWAADVTRTWPVSGKYSPTQRALYEIVLQAEVDAIAQVRPGVRYRDVHLTAARTLTRGLVDLKILNGDVDGLVERGVHAMFFPHGVGHIIGLDVHDMENFGDLAGYAPGRERSTQFGLGYLRLDRDLVEGMAVTVEPGFYQVPGILQGMAAPYFEDKTINRNELAKYADVRGIRIEDDVLCTNGAPEVFSAEIPKSVADVEAAVLSAR